MKQSLWQTLMGICLLAVVALLSWQADRLVPAENGQIKAARERPVVVLDAGHGGNDPGKVGIGGQLEKDINLAITERLKAYLEASDVEVVLTREKDEALYSSGASHKKMSDMKQRCEIINQAEPDLVVSIHQNSYHEENVSGGQVFYYKDSEKGRRLAQILQSRFDYVLGEGNRRKEKANDSYYLLMHIKAPIVIVECGFLSNSAEAGKLEDTEYQDRMAWTIHMGIMEYLNAQEAGTQPLKEAAGSA